MTPSPATEKETWRLLLFRSGGSELLLASGIDHLYRLPEICTPRSERTAPHLNAEMRHRWNLEAVSLYDLPSGEERPEGRQHYVAEAISSEDAAPAGFDWVPVSAITSNGFSEPSDYPAVERWLTSKCFVNPAADSLPFAAFGWFHDLVRWVQHVIRPRGMRLNNRFRQLNAGPTFALLRFETERRAVWFKAAGPPNAHEFLVTTTLAAHFPGYLPELLATHDAWNGWLMLEADGKTLFESLDVAEWQKAVISLAQFQVTSVPRTDEILSAGARDLRLHNLRRLVGPFFGRMERVMRQQEKTSPPPLSQAALCRLRQNIGEILVQLEDLDLPDAVGHLDCNPGNIFVSPTGCTFLDWAEAAIGNPTFTFQYLLEYSRNNFGTDSTAVALLTSAYSKSWESILEPVAMKKALKLAPAAALFAHAAAFVARRDVAHIEAPGTAVRLRSLTRRLDREVEALRSLEMVT